MTEKEAALVAQLKAAVAPLVQVNPLPLSRCKACTRAEAILVPLRPAPERSPATRFKYRPTPACASSVPSTPMYATYEHGERIIMVMRVQTGEVESQPSPTHCPQAMESFEGHKDAERHAALVRQGRCRGSAHRVYLAMHDSPGRACGIAPACRPEFPTGNPYNAC